MSTEQTLGELHHELIRGILQRGACPTNGELARALRIDETEVEARLLELEAIHGAVLHPHACRPWIVHPFSLTPTINWIESEAGRWWAPCVWCAFGVAALAGQPSRIHTRLGAEAEPVVIETAGGKPNRTDLCVHFAIPPSRAWENVHQHCSLVLPFRSPSDIRSWCERYGVTMGEAVPLRQVAELAQRWYGRHADRSWRKWSVAEAREIFASAGLVSEFWALPERAGRF